MANVNINWDSINKKIDYDGYKKTSEKSTTLGYYLAGRFIATMKAAIDEAHGLTGNEKAVIQNHPIELVDCKTYADFRSKTPMIEIYLDFDFQGGSRSLVSISPNKQIYDAIALFNNGYPGGNNVNPKKPPRGIWHGKPLTIRPRARDGAHFIEHAITDFSYGLLNYGAQLRDYSIDMYGLS